MPATMPTREFVLLGDPASRVGNSDGLASMYLASSWKLEDSGRALVSNLTLKQTSQDLPDQSIQLQFFDATGGGEGPGGSVVGEGAVATMLPASGACSPSKFLPAMVFLHSRGDLRQS